MEFWNEIKKQIKLETKWYFEPKKIDTDPLVDTIKKLFNAPIDSQYSLGGLATTYTNALFKVIDEDSSKKDRISNFEVLKNVEPFLKKILYFMDFQKFLVIKDEQKGLTPIIKNCGLNPDNIFMDEGHLEKYTEDNYEYHLIKVFILRNLESHNCELWSSRELESNIATELIVYMEAINRSKDRIGEKLADIKNDFSEYIQNEISCFEIWASRFVATNTVEDFSVFESYAIENISSNNEEREEDNEEDEKIIKERAGTVDFIRKNKLPEKRMMLWGEAGLGKSTTLQYLTYLDAKTYKEDITREIPVYIPLGMLINHNETLESYIFNKLEIGVEEGRTLLETGRLNLFLDGVNEIPEDKTSDILSNRIKEIQLLIDSYPKTLIIISNRPEKYNQFKNIPVFRLQPMDYEKIMNFLDRNTRSGEVRTLIKEKIRTNTRLFNIICTPLMTTRLISIVQEFKKVPESEGMIIKNFLDALYKRERVEKQDAKFDGEKINYLLTNLALYGFKKNGTNSGITKYEVLKCFSSCLEEFHFEYDTVYAVEILIKMGVLNCDSTGEIIVFSHQAYQDYYLSRTENFSLLTEEEVKKKSKELGKKRDDEIYCEISKDVKYEKVIAYHIHNLKNEYAYVEMDKLSIYNILLVSKTYLTGNYDLEYRKKISKKILEIFISSFDIEEKADCLSSALLINDSTIVNEILQNLLNIDLCNKDEKKRFTIEIKPIIRLAIKELNEDQVLDLIRTVCSMDIYERVKNGVFSCILGALSKNNLFYNFCWNDVNLNDIKTILKYLSSLTIYKRINSISIFNIPKNYLDETMINEARSLLGGAHDGIVELFFEKYYPQVKITNQLKMDILLKNPKTKVCYIQKLLNILLEEDPESFILYFQKDSRIRSLVFINLCNSLQFQLVAKYKYFYFGNINMNYKLNFYKIAEELFISKYSFIVALFHLYQERCEVFEPIQVSKIENIESVSDLYETNISNIYIPSFNVQKLEEIIHNEALNVSYRKMLEDGLKSKYEDTEELSFFIIQKKYKIICKRFRQKELSMIPRFKWYLKSIKNNLKG